MVVARTFQEVREPRELRKKYANFAKERATRTLQDIWKKTAWSVNDTHKEFST